MPYKDPDLARQGCNTTLERFEAHQEAIKEYLNGD